LFVSTSSWTSISELYQGSLFSQQRVPSYTELLQGTKLAQRTIDKLGLNTTAEDLDKRVSVRAKPDTVLINLQVLDESPVQARDIANTMADEFVAMAGELETPQNDAAPDARVIVEQRASLANKPVTPKTTRNIALGVAVGVLLGVGLALLRDRLDNTVKDRRSLEEITHVGLVGTIPLDKDRRNEPAIAFGRDHTAIAESFRELRTNFQFLNVENPPRLIVVTSSLPNEGKTTTAINIALALAEAGHNVALVDGGMRRPTLDKYLNVVGTVGFSTVLSGEASLSDVLQKTSMPGLTVLTSGPIPPNPSELLGSLAAQKVLSELRAQFDYVVVDSSPLLAVTDSAILATHSDGVLVMARYGQTKHEQLAHAIRNLESVGVTPLGAVLTMAPTRVKSSYSYRYDHHGKRTGKQTSEDTPEPKHRRSSGAADGRTPRPVSRCRRFLGLGVRRLPATSFSGSPAD
ncbi:MAG: tyrosine-protein kinase, partial [Mycobacterium sp.]|nr:tyrosine-protein kinase [Mycobacterium sp.]